MSGLTVDSNFAPHEALALSPEQARECPDEVLQSLGLMAVHYWGFDAREHAGQIVLATRVMADVEAFFQMAYELRFPIAKVVPAAAAEYQWDDLKLQEDNVSSGFNYRKILGTDTLSTHAFGIAFDINPQQNPHVVFGEEETTVYPPEATWDPEAPGTLHAEHPLVKLMEGLGWEWGGNWTPDTGRTDYQHFQKP